MNIALHPSPPLSPVTLHTIDVQPSETPGDGPEWLLTNGTGAYAMGTVAGINSRRYHGLLIASQRPPVRRIAVLNQMLEQLTPALPDRHEQIAFTTCRFLDDQARPVHTPNGHRHLRRFEKGNTVAWHYATGRIRFTRRLTLHWKHQAATLHYTLSGLSCPMVFTLSPMVTLRDFHSLLDASASPVPTVDVAEQACIVRRDGMAATLTSPTARFHHAEDWWRAIDYVDDAARGQDHAEDYFVPGRFAAMLDREVEQQILLTVAWGEQHHAAPLATQRTIHPVHGIDPDGPDAETFRCLAEAAEDFVVDRVSPRGDFTTIMAGYPWFADWGRDTFIALPGLMLCTGRFEEAAQTLRVYADAMRDGLMPNRFDDYDDRDAHYNTVDASLWFAHAALAYVDAASDRQAWSSWLQAAVMRVIEAYLEGTPPEVEPASRIVVDADGLVRAGSPQTQWTWMDAARDGVIFTPRHGKAVEINALWHHVLVGTAALSRGSARGRLQRLAARALAAFKPMFWCDAEGYLADHVWVDDVGRTQRSATLRPNQIFAVSLEHTPLPRQEQRHVLLAVRRALLTPFGLRTLSPDDPAYQGRYGIGWFQRDAAYHQGTVWPWLLGPYAEAVMRVDDFSAKARNAARNTLSPLLQRLCGEGLGQLHELHDGDAPHQPAGCMAQAWSVAEVLRVLALSYRAVGTPPG